jgi:hypothetical protein
MPQRWYFFRLQSPRLELEENEQGEILAKWNEDFNDKDRVQVARFLKSELRRLHRLKEAISLVEKGRKNNVPESEWNVIRMYYDAIVTAMYHGLEALEEDVEAACAMEGSPCEHYVDLSGDDLPHTIQSCESTPTPWFEGWEDLNGTVETSTRIVEFYENPNDSDICMVYDNKLHVCSSYRSHFYKNFAHFAAQYIEKVERVLIIGGNSMALHEVLKSDDLELVAVLGRDPQTPHKSFLDFETQPHFDDDRLEWWFGDFAQTLSVLPEEYLSSFDLVLVEEIPGVEYRLSRIVQRLC